MVKQTGSTYKWTASILSDNIPDGPAEIHIVAFDEAGNVNSGYVETSIQNNRPRIARVYLATDLNGNAETTGDYKFDFYSFVLDFCILHRWEKYDTACRFLLRG